MIDKETISDFRDELEVKIKDILIWAFAQAAVTETAKTARDNDPNKMKIDHLYSLFRLHFIPERNKFDSRAVFFGVVRKDVWTRLLQVEKNCNFDNGTPAKFFSPHLEQP